VAEGKKATLTPLESELRAIDNQIAPAPPTLATRFQRRFGRRGSGPTTLLGAILHGLLRLAIAVGLASGVALSLDHWFGRSAALGFYIVGAALLAVAFSTSAGMSGRMGGWYMYHGSEGRERRFNLGIAYIGAGALVIAIGVAIEALTR
jgi:hypothetical protein